MKNLVKAAGGAALGLFLLSSCTINKPAEQLRTVTVSGTGTVSVKPDTATLDFSVRTYNWFAKEAVSLNAQTMAKVIDAVKAAGVGEGNITTAEYSVDQEKSWQNGRQVLGRYIVSNTLHAVISNTDTTGEIIDAAVKAGATGLSALRFTLSDTSAAVRQARTQAVRQAQDAAALLAGASGCGLGQVISISEDSGSAVLQNNFAAVKLAAATDAGAAVTPIEEANVKVTARVTITYALQ